MRLIHISDLHLGKRLNEYSLIEDQRYILQQIIEVIDERKADVVLVAGDIYDKTVPSEEAMMLWDGFLNALARRGILVFAISGNHDSAVRFANLGTLVSGAGIHLAAAYHGEVSPVVLSDEFGEVNVYMLPFVKPSTVRPFFPDDEVKSYTDAVRLAVAQMRVDETKRNVLIAHQFVTGAQRCESEEIVVGGVDNVDAGVFDAFDYVALGHIHGPQSVTREFVRYCGTPLKYSFSEKNHHKSVTVIELLAKGEIRIETVPLKPLHDLREIRGAYEEVMSKSFYEGTDVTDYLHIVLTDEEDVPDAMAKLRIIYPNLMRLTYDNKRTRQSRVIEEVVDVRKSEFDLFSEFYELQNNQPMSDKQQEFTRELIQSILGV